MTFAWPLALLALVAVPLLLAGYVWADRRRRRRAVTHSSVALIRAAAPARSAWRRHLPAALLLGALALLGLAVARPQARTQVPVSSSSVILALDVSGSMCATDVQPNRLSAAQGAVRDFIRAQDSGTQIGIVTFSGFAQLSVAPTKDRAELLRAVDSLTVGRGTTIGSAILKSIDAIAAINPAVAPADEAQQRVGTRASPSPAPGTPGAMPAPRRAGSYAPEIVVLLTDGANTQGTSPQRAAQVAAERGVRVYPIGFGTTSPTTSVCTAEQLGGSSFENFSGYGGQRPGQGLPGAFLTADEPALQEVASVTGGQYFAAAGSAQLQQVLGDLPRHVELQERDVELGAGLAGVAVVLVLLGVGAAVRWSVFPA